MGASLWALLPSYSQLSRVKRATHRKTRPIRAVPGGVWLRVASCVLASHPPVTSLGGTEFTARSINRARDAFTPPGPLYCHAGAPTRIRP